MISFTDVRNKKVISVKPALKVGVDRTQLDSIFGEIIRIEHFRVVEEKFTAEKKESSIRPALTLDHETFQPSELPYEELGIIQRMPQIGFTKRDWLPYKYYEKSISKYIGSLRLLAEVLYGFEQIRQDLSLMIPEYGTNGIENVSPLLAYADIWLSKNILSEDYPDLVQFMGIFKDLSFANISGVCNFDDIAPEHRSVIERGKRNIEVLRLIRKLPDYIEE